MRLASLESRVVASAPGFESLLVVLAGARPPGRVGVMSGAAFVSWARRVSSGVSGPRLFLRVLRLAAARASGLIGAAHSLDLGAWHRGAVMAQW